MEDNIANVLDKSKLLIFKTAVGDSFDSIFITDIDKKIIYVNSAFEKLTGYNKKEVYGNIPAIFKSGKLDPSIYREFWRTILRGRVWKQELTNARKDKTTYHSMIKIIPIKNELGDIRYFLGIEKDITMQKKFEEQLFIYKHFPDLKTDPIIQTNYKGSIAIIGEKTSKIFFDKAKIKNIKEILGRDAEKIINDIKNTGREKRGEKIFSKNDKYYQVTAVDIPSINAVNFYFSDVTEIKKAEDGLMKRAEELEKFNKMAVGRELKMVELKKRIKELEGKLRNK